RLEGLRRAAARGTASPRVPPGGRVSRRDARRGLAAALLALLLLWLVGYPLLVTLAQALEAPRWTLRHFVDFARRPEEWRALWASIWISRVTVGLAAAIGVPPAVLFERADFPGRRVPRPLVAPPGVPPPPVAVSAFPLPSGQG